MATADRRRRSPRAQSRPSVLRPIKHDRIKEGHPFLANACIKVEGGSLVAIDSLGVRHRFPLNGQPTAPAVIANVLDLSGNPFPCPDPMA